MDANSMLTVAALDGSNASRAAEVAAFYRHNSKYFGDFAENYKRAIDEGPARVISFLRMQFTNEGFLCDLHQQYGLMQRFRSQTFPAYLDQLRYDVASLQFKHQYKPALALLDYAANNNKPALFSADVAAYFCTNRALCTEATFETYFLIKILMQSYADLPAADFAYFKKRLMQFGKNSLAGFGRSCNVSAPDMATENVFSPGDEHTTVSTDLIAGELSNIRQKLLTKAQAMAPKPAEYLKSRVQSAFNGMDAAAVSLIKDLRAYFAPPAARILSAGGTFAPQRRSARRTRTPLRKKRSLTPKQRR